MAFNCVQDRTTGCALQDNPRREELCEFAPVGPELAGLNTPGTRAGHEKLGV